MLKNVLIGINSPRNIQILECPILEPVNNNQYFLDVQCKVKDFQCKYQRFHYWKQQLAEIFRIYKDSNFSFECHINRICYKASQKLHALPRIAKYISEDKKRVTLISFIISQFSYCLIDCISHRTGLNNKINNIHERT